MRNFRLAALAVLFSGITAVAYAQQTATASAPAPIAKQNTPLGGTPVDPTITTKGGTGAVSTSYLIQDAPLKSDFVMGKRTAPVVIVEYASLSCPHCAHFSNTVLPELDKKYIQTGKVAYILRQFPLNEPALRGAMLVNCVGESSEEQYYVFNRVLFDAQPRWAFDANFLAGLETIATVGGLSKLQFKNCIENKNREMEVLQAKKTTNDELKVPHTPYLFIAGEAYEGEKTIGGLSKVIDAKLAKSAAK
jgi:protein-disulfide isomerase